MTTTTEATTTLDGQIASRVASGYRLESQSSSSAVLVRGRRPNHVLHLILTLCTLGIWGMFVWAPVAAFGGEKRIALTVSPDGIVSTAKGRG